MRTILAIALGGALGAVGRHLVGVQVLHLLGSRFPWATLTVNIVGSAVMGVLVELMAIKLAMSPELRAFLTVGVLGGFTTFSTFSLEVALLLERGAPALAAVYVLASVTASVGGLFAGLFAVRALVP